MIVDCRSCGATYNISDEKIRGRRVRVRCKSCGDGIIVDGASLQADDATRVYSTGFNPAAYGETSDEATRVMSPGMVDLRAPTQVGSTPEEPGPDEWLVNLSDTDQRAMTLGQMVSAYASGVLTDDAFVWRDGMADWLPLLDVDAIRDAVGVADADEATQVVRPVDLRAPARPAAKGAPAPRAAPPVAYSAPAAPPRGRTSAEPSSSVEYAMHAPPIPPPPRAPAGQARVRERPRSDLFGGIDAAGGEAELLKSSSMALEQYEEPKPTGARNESSVLFSLNALKAGRQGPVSAPPRLIAAAPAPPTAADILGMTAGGAIPGLGMESTAALLAAPAVEAPPSPPQRHSTIPPRARMDTTPPAERKKGSGWLLPVLALVVVGAAGAGAFVFKDRLLPAPGVAEAQATQGAPPPSAAPANVPAPPAATTALAVAPASVAPPEPPPVEASAAPEPPPLVPAAAAAPARLAAPAAKPAPAPRAGSEPSPAAEGALAAAIRPPGAPAPKTEAPPPGDESTKGAAKVTLEEEGSEGAAAAAEAEVTLPPFDTAAAKGALEAAAASAASCKKPDGPAGKGKVQVTFSPKTGRATSANVVEGAFGGTPVGGCVAKLFRAAKVPPFSGDPVSVAKSFSIPE